jgi:hypothetical protein
VITALHHVQLAAPAGAEPRLRSTPARSACPRVADRASLTARRTETGVMIAVSGGSMQSTRRCHRKRRS